MVGATPRRVYRRRVARVELVGVVKWGLAEDCSPTGGIRSPEGGGSSADPLDRALVA